jgi:putative FmdB family regulatory protein
MPIYEYLCSKCGTEFELRRSFSEADKPAPCPKCGADSEKLVSVFASKSGFYLKAPEKAAFRKPPQST